MQITTEIIDGVIYYGTVLRGVTYTIFQQDAEWCVLSRRNALMNQGTCRYFETLAAVEKKIKGLFGISALLQPMTDVQA
ncbi:MAG: hypothetical protein GY841_15835 [FCB group bacterium]|nr:hypothetical protein [FCB group bacterium]